MTQSPTVRAVTQAALGDALAAYTPGGGAAGETTAAATHGVTAANTRNTRAALADCREGLRDVHLTTIGDSIGAGGNSSAPRGRSYLACAARSLAARLGLTARRGLVPVWSFGSYDPQWTVPSSWSTSFATIFGAAANGVANTAGNTTDVLTFTPTDDAGTPIATDSFVILAQHSGDAAGFQWSIDGGAWTTLTPTNLTGVGYNAYPVPAGAVGIHTLRIRALSSGVCYIGGAEAVNSTKRGIRYFQSGDPGKLCPEPGVMASNFLGTVRALGTDLLVPEWGTNDYGLQTPVASFRASVASTAAAGLGAARPMDVLWLAVAPQGGTPKVIPQADYYAALDAASDAAGHTWGVLHMDRIVTSYAVGSAAPMSGYDDPIHPNDSGHALIGSALAAVLAAL